MADRIFGTKDTGPLGPTSCGTKKRRSQSPVDCERRFFWDAVEETIRALRDRCHNRVPVVVAGSGPRMMGVAARHGDEWNCGMMEADRRVALLEALERACEKAQRNVKRSALVTALGGEPPSGELARRYNWHLAFRGTSTKQLIGEIEELAALGFDAVHLGGMSPTAWNSMLGALEVWGRHSG